MASSLYDPILESWVAGGAGHTYGVIVDLEEGTGSSDIKGIFVSSEYTLDRTDQYYDDLNGGLSGTCIVQANGGGDQTFSLASSAVTQENPGIKWDAADLTGASQITGVGDGTDSIDAIVLYSDEGSGNEDPLICFIDTGTGFGLVPNNSTIEITWAAGGILTIGA